MQSKEFIIESSPLDRREMGAGMESMQNNEVALVGGFRSGNSSAGKTRLKYMVYDLRNPPEKWTPEEQNARESGFVELFIADGSGDITGLVNIEISTKNRKAGIGRAVIDALKATAGTLEIYDIKQKAVPFWRKMGAKFFKDSKFRTPATKTTGANTGLFAII
jgi:hypothetical protein